MKPITIKNEANETTGVFLIPAMPDRFKVNCNGQWGQFTTNNCDAQNISLLEAKENNMLRGTWVEIALAWVQPEVIQTYEPHYIAESFGVFWGIPTAGELKDEYPAPTISGLKRTMMRSESREAFVELINEFSKILLTKWTQTTMLENEGFDEYFARESGELICRYIWRFQFEKKIGKMGPYYVLKPSYREPKTEFEKAACEAAVMINQAVSQGMPWCEDPMISKAQEKAMVYLAEKQALLAPSQTKEPDSKKQLSGKK